MARFLTPEWAAAFNDALEGVTLPAPGPDAGLLPADGRFSFAEEVTGAPGGDVRVVLRVDDGHLRLSLGPVDDRSDPDDVDLTIVLDYDDAVALAGGRLAVADALNAGRVRVRGDLSVLVAGQELLVAARSATGALHEATTY